MTEGPAGEPLAVVVGATGALGGAIVRRLRGRGVPVLAVARAADALGALTADDGGVAACAGDIGEDIGDDAAGPAIADAVAAWGAPVRMVVQAAGLPALGGLDTVDPAALGAAVALKVGGMLRLVRAVDPWLTEGSRLVALGGHYGAEPSPHVPGAGVTNAALANLVRQLADAYGPRGITAHLVAPGPADTDRLRRLSAERAAARGVDVEEILAERRAESPLGALVTPDQVGWAVATLLDPEATALTGSTLALDMGARRGL
ncbi:SDR family oxidoreductase [Actinomycetospora cinnamomea]|uniref:NADP-dependent 3-hydroxy acid dehydrogenase YdfG n=1 Tax=Actinomycetospora cinnamomea TaxID=663609 RepID=A0A2U1FIM1_9PSEU|nr:SDR family oxidoreductase [Actinomycetospora cinnamomea]PVZ12035.1 NADP-dependent 3-hydroxy acid dehydrogenase YdfG [Actinomycetospora cinnamomea]